MTERQELTEFERGLVVRTNRRQTTKQIHAHFVQSTETAVSESTVNKLCMKKSCKVIWYHLCKDWSKKLKSISFNRTMLQSTKANSEINLMKWPGQSPDLNPIEDLWDKLEHHIRIQKTPKT